MAVAEKAGAVKRGIVRNQRRAQLTPKEIKFLKGLAEGKTKVKAAMDAYPTATYGTAAAIATDNLNKPKIREALEVAYEKAGINAKSITDVLTQAMKANKTAVFQGAVFASDHPDHGIRVQAARTAAQLVIDKDESGGGPTLILNLGTQNFTKQ